MWQLFGQKNTKIGKHTHAFKGYASSYNFDILNYFNPELQLKDTESGIRNRLIEILTELKSFKLMTTLVMEFKKKKKIESDDATKYSTFYPTSKAETVINESNIDDAFGSIYTTIISNIQKCLGKDLVLIIDSVVRYTSNISNFSW